LRSTGYLDKTDRRNSCCFLHCP